MVSVGCSDQKVTPAPAPSLYALIPAPLVGFFRATGLFPYSCSRDGALSFSWKLTLWAGFVFVFVSTFAADYAYNYSIVYADKLAELEFYSLVACIFRNSSFILSGVVLAVMVVRSKEVAEFLQYWQHFVLSSSTSAQARKVFVAGYFGLWWNVVTTAVVVFSVYWSWVLILAIDVSVDWNLGVDFLAAATKIPVCYHAFYLSVGKSLCVLVTNGPQILIALCAYGIGLGFKTTKDSLKKNWSSSSDAEEALRRALVTHRRAMHVLSTLNEVFSTVIFLECFQDAVVSVAFLAVVLEERSTLDRSMVWFTFCFTLIGVVNAVVRIGISLFCFEEVKHLRLAAEKVRVQYEDNKAVVEASCKLIEETGRSTPALSCGGCFYVTREFVVTAFSLLTTYFVLIYQTRDQKHDNQELESEITNNTAQLKEAIEVLHQDLRALVQFYNNTSV